MGDVSKEEVRAALGAVLALSEAIRGLGEVPSGVLYANVCGHLSINAYEGAVGVLKRAGLVSEANHVLRWIGPEVKA